MRTTFFALALLAWLPEAGADVLFDDTFPTPGVYGPSYTATPTPGGGEAAGYPLWVDASALGGPAFAHAIAFQPGSLTPPDYRTAGLFLFRSFTLPPLPAGADGWVVDAHVTLGLVVNTTVPSAPPINGHPLYADFALAALTSFVNPGTTTVATHADTSASPSGFERIDLDLPANFMLPGLGQLEIALSSSYAPGTVTFYLGEVTATITATAIPEPGPLALAGIAIVAAAVVRSLRKARSY
jgi:hypothetical protein